MSAALAVEDLGTCGYADAYARQVALNAAVQAGKEPATLLLVEHPPVVTVSRRRAASGHVLLSAVQARRLGVAVAETDRGGDVTLHAPGQLVAYPILDLSRYGLNLGTYMRLLEQAVIDTLGGFGVCGGREAGATGVWIGAGSAAAKVCAMGVRVRKHVTLHGLALNVSNDLSLFNLIDPCGLGFRPVTRLRDHAAGVGVEDVKPALAETLNAALKLPAPHDR